MEKENVNREPQEEDEGPVIYVVGAIIVVTVIVAAILMWPKPKPGGSAVTPAPEGKVISKPQLTKLTCENEWYNPMIGVSKFYLSAEGGDVTDGKSVDCTFVLTRDGNTILTDKVSVPVVDAPERGGTTFRCTTKALNNIPQGVSIKMTTTVKNAEGKTATCAGDVTFRGQ